MITRKKIKEAEEYLAENLINKEEVQVILETIGHFLLNAELYSCKKQRIIRTIEPVDPKKT